MRRIGLGTFVLALGLLTGAPGSSANPYDDYKALNRAERQLVLRYFWQVLRVRGAASFARDEAGRRYPAQVGQDDPRDAFRHATWNASMVRRLKSREAARRWADAHESDPANPPVRRAMDLHNNASGRELAWDARTDSGPWWWRTTRFPGDDALADAVEQAVGAGRLVMIEEVAGRRDPYSGRLVPTR